MTGEGDGIFDDPKVSFGESDSILMHKECRTFLRGEGVRPPGFRVVM
jgi:hypothetical protein